MAATRCFHGDRAALTGLRLRRIVSFLRHHRLYDTAHALEGQTGAFFDAAHFRRLLRALRWADASYALGFVAVGEYCSREADLLIVRILILRVMADLAAGRVRAGDDLFHRLYASLHAHPDAQQLRRILLSMRSDRARASRLFNHLRPMAVDAIVNLADKCPELKAKARLPQCTSDPANAMSLGPVLWGYKAPHKNKAGCIPADVLARSFMRKRPLVSHEMKSSGRARRLQFSAVVLLHLRRLHRFLKCQGLYSTAHMLERESLVYLDAAHLHKLVEDRQWDAAWGYLRPSSPLWERGEGTSQNLFTAFLHLLEHHSMLNYLACRGDQGGRAASSLFWWSDDDAFRCKSPETAQRHDLYRSMASEQARASVNWEAIKLTTLEKLQELLRQRSDPECSLRREPQCTSTPSQIIPLGSQGCFQRHRRKKTVDRKPARELACFLIQKRLSSSKDTRHSGDSGSGVSTATLLQPNKGKRALDDISSSAAEPGTKRLRSQDDYCTGNAQQPFDPASLGR